MEVKMNGEKSIYYWKKIQWINFSDEKYFHGPKVRFLIIENC